MKFIISQMLLTAWAMINPEDQSLFVIKQQKVAMRSERAESGEVCDLFRT